MKTIAFTAVALLLTGCAQVGSYDSVIKAPAPSGLAGYWQSTGPQSSLVSPEAVGSLIVTQAGDTLDCRQWQRVIARPGKLMLRDDTLYNVTEKTEVYPIVREGDVLEYDGMRLQRVAKPTVECAAVLARTPLNSVLP